MRLTERNASYYQSTQEAKDKNLSQRVEDLRKVAQFPEMRIKHQQVWLEAVGIELMEAREFMRREMFGRPSCVRYLNSVAERARYRITLKNGCLDIHCLCW